MFLFVLVCFTCYFPYVLVSPVKRIPSRMTSFKVDMKNLGNVLAQCPIGPQLLIVDPQAYGSDVTCVPLHDPRTNDKPDLEKAKITLVSPVPASAMGRQIVNPNLSQQQSKAPSRNRTHLDSTCIALPSPMSPCKTKTSPTSTKPAISKEKPDIISKPNKSGDAAKISRMATTTPVAKNQAANKVISPAELVKPIRSDNPTVMIPMTMMQLDKQQKKKAENVGPPQVDAKPDTVVPTKSECPTVMMPILDGQEQVFQEMIEKRTQKAEAVALNAKEPQQGIKSIKSENPTVIMPGNMNEQKQIFQNMIRDNPPSTAQNVATNNLRVGSDTPTYLIAPQDYVNIYEQNPANKNLSSEMKKSETLSTPVHAGTSWQVNQALKMNKRFVECRYGIPVTLLRAIDSFLMNKTQS